MLWRQQLLRKLWQHDNNQQQFLTWAKTRRLLGGSFSLSFSFTKRMVMMRHASCFLQHLPFVPKPVRQKVTTLPNGLRANGHVANGKCHNSWVAGSPFPLALETGPFPLNLHPLPPVSETNTDKMAPLKRPEKGETSVSQHAHFLLHSLDRWNPS